MPIEGLRDALGHRAKIGILVPATNTIVEPELAAPEERQRDERHADRDQQPGELVGVGLELVDQ